MFGCNALAVGRVGVGLDCGDRRDAVHAASRVPFGARSDRARGFGRQATTTPADPAGLPGAGCGRFVEQWRMAASRYAVKFFQPQANVRCSSR